MTWRNIALAVFGAWFVVASWILGLTHNGLFLWSGIILGGLTLLGALWAVQDRQPTAWRQWVFAVFGAWLGLTPWIANYSSHVGASWLNGLVGLAMVVAAIWNALTKEAEAADRPSHRQAS
jgi:hypothetical protein